MRQKRLIYFSNDNWEIWRWSKESTIRVECWKDSPNGFVDYPVQYKDKRIAFDYPERIPEYIRKEVAKAFTDSALKMLPPAGGFRRP